MKNRYIIIIFLSGIIYSVVGILFKILHFEIGIFTGSVILTLGLLLMFIATFIFIAKILLNKNNSILHR
jgi:hypothetical protein